MRAEIHYSYQIKNLRMLSLLEGAVVMKVLVGCEYSGIVREAFRALGHDAWSCDIIESDDNSPHHLVEDVRAVIHWQDWDLAIFHPPCQYLAVSGIHWNKRVPGRDALTDEAIEFVRELMDAPIHRIAVENPRSVISSRIRPADQLLHPYHFGEPYTKGTCFWLKNLPKLQATDVLELPERGYWDNQTPSRQNNASGTKDKPRWAVRSKTYEGIARAIASQWGLKQLEPV